MKKLLFLPFIIVALMLLPTKSFSQVSAVKLNAPALLVGVINPEIETAISPSMSMNLALVVYPWGKIPIKGNHLLNFSVQPGVRYWFHGLHTGVFIGAHATATYTEISFRNKDYRAAGVGLGISAGYAWMLSPRWNLELELGGSAMYMRYDKRPVGGTYKGRLANSRILPLPTKAGLNIVYLF